MTTRTRLVRLAKGALLSLLILIPLLLFIGYSVGARVHYADNPLAQDWDNEGPYVFFREDGELGVQYIRAHASGSFFAEESTRPIESPKTMAGYYPLDSTSFEFEVRTQFEVPASVYDDGNPILAVSDIEGNYGALRDFLIDAGVIEANLDWTFGAGHLVLVGDLVDRGYFVTQALWLVYKLEQDARRHGGRVHYIIGNHELKMMYGDYGATDPKYAEVAAILGKSQSDLYGPQSLLGRWMASKNAVERINGVLFVHGGLHPEVTELALDLEAVNQRVRRSYYQPASRESSAFEGDLLVSRDWGVCWYRGYFEDDLHQDEIDRILEAFDAQAVVVGHTLQKRVSRHHGGAVIAIDVAHPNDDHKLWPEGQSEGLLIEDGVYYRVLEGGVKQAI
jgi:hypothetical protein